MHAWGGWVAVNIVAVGVFQGNQYAWNTRFVWIKHTVGIGVFVDLTCNGVARFTKVVTRGLGGFWQDDVGNCVVAKRSWHSTVGVFTIVVTCWLGFGNRVRAFFQTVHFPSAIGIGGGGNRNRVAINVFACNQHACAWKSWFGWLFDTIVVVVPEDLTSKARGCFAKVNWGHWRTNNNCDWNNVAWVFARAVPCGLSFFNSVIACGLWWEAVIAVCVSHGAGNDCSCCVLQDHRHAW